MTFKYTLSEKAVYNQESGVYSMNIIESEMTPLTIDGRETIGGVMCVEIQTYQLVSDSSWTTQMPTYHYEWVTTATYCSSGGAGGNSWTGGDNVGTTVSSNPSNGGYPQQGGYPPSTGGGSGPVINNGPPINTSPIPIDDVVENEDTTTPCDELKEKSEDSQFMAKFNFLNRNQVFNRDHETAYFESKNNNQIVYTYFQGNSETTSAVGSDNTHSGIHVHNNNYTFINDQGVEFYVKTVKMFSPKDLHTFINGYQEQAAASGISPMETYCMMLSSEGIYAIKILNPNETIDVFALRAFQKDYKDKSEEIINRNLSLANRKIELQKLFLNLIKKVGLENKVGLFEGTVTPSQTGNKLNWSRKSLDNNNNIVTNPC